MIVKDSYLLKPYVVVDDLGPHPCMVVGFYDYTNMRGKWFRFKQTLSNMMSERSFEYYRNRYWYTKPDLSRFSGTIVRRGYYCLFKNPSHFEKEFACMVPSGRCCSDGRARTNGLACHFRRNCLACTHVDYYRFVGTRCRGLDCVANPIFIEFSYGVRRLSSRLCTIESVMRARWKRARRSFVSRKVA
jgi:hypothetical protein